MNQYEIAEQLVKAEQKFEVCTMIMALFSMPIKVKIPFSRKHCAADIDELELSVRATNCLKRAKIMTVRELIDVVQSDELKKYRSLGTKTYVEIKSKLLRYGYQALSEQGKKIFWMELLQDNNRR